MTSRFGNRTDPISGESSYHNGLDIAVPENTEAAAPADGEITETGYNIYNGNFLRLKTSEGLIITYAHLNKSLVSEGQHVKRGETVALTGTTGRSTGPHLHISVYDADGNYRDPEDFIQVE